MLPYSISNWEIIDLSQPLSPSMPRWPGTEPLAVEVLSRLEDDGVYERRLSLPEHVGTHVDAPSHFAPGGLNVDQLELRRLVAPARVFDLRPLVQEEPDFALSARQLRGLEGSHGALRGGEIALFCTGWDRFLDSAGRYVGPQQGTPRFPGLSADAAELAVDRGVIGLGIDTLGVEPGAASGYPLHQITLRAGLFHIEGMVGLERLPTEGAQLVVAPLPIEGGSGAPARVFALVAR